MRLLVVEDHPLFREGLTAMAALLRPEWRLTFAASHTEALAALVRYMPDAVVIDVRLGSEDGIALAAALHAAHSTLPIMVMSGNGCAAVRRRAVAAGASGFVGKEEDAAVIAAALDAVIAGERHFPPDAPGDAPALTPRQAEVLALLAAGHGNKEMRYRLGIAERTVRAHLTELFGVLGAASRTQALIRARELGLI